MDNTRLNELAARAMGWVKKSEKSAWLPQLGDDEFWEGTAGEGRRLVQKWNPAGCADDALVLLEKVADGFTWKCSKLISGMYVCYITVLSNGLAASGIKSASLAITLAALRASPEVTEEQMQEAMA